jgi:hypothetical protein
LSYAQKPEDEVKFMKTYSTFNVIFRAVLVVAIGAFMGAAGAQQKFVRGQATDVKKEDAQAHDALLCIGTGSTLGGTGGSASHTHTGPSHTHSVTQASQVQVVSSWASVSLVGHSVPLPPFE